MTADEKEFHKVGESAATDDRLARLEWWTEHAQPVIDRLEEDNAQLRRTIFAFGVATGAILGNDALRSGEPAAGG